MEQITTKDEKKYTFPFFLPVFEYGNSFFSLKYLQEILNIDKIITNAYFLYKNREYRPTVLEQGIKKFLNFDGLVITDSGAFQQFSRPLYLSNSTIIAFQEEIGVDFTSPLDVITTPFDNRVTAKKKLNATLKRVKEGLSITQRSTLIGVQQGGRFLDLRAQALHELMVLGIQYIALGSLVPFFNKNHDFGFVGRVIRQAREIVPAQIPLHLYGGGDPLELPFYIALGCNIFDSSSFIHYAQDGWYMTPYGALRRQKTLSEEEYSCPCPFCKEGDLLWCNVSLLAAHNLWVILFVIEQARTLLAEGTLFHHLDHVIKVHCCWFPKSSLAHSWRRVVEA
jgi:7-cyano-7-deazaguanine tRNA-ribosyltransferase